MKNVFSGQNGEEACEGHGFDQDQCLQVGCCEWDDNSCWSSIGDDECSRSKYFYSMLIEVFVKLYLCIFVPGEGSRFSVSYVFFASRVRENF